VLYRPVDNRTFSYTVAAAENIYIGAKLPENVLAVAPQRFNLYALYVLCHLFHNFSLLV
jgi:hypothetical protein